MPICVMIKLQNNYKNAVSIAKVQKLEYNINSSYSSNICREVEDAEASVILNSL